MPRIAAYLVRARFRMIKFIKDRNGNDYFSIREGFRGKRVMKEDISI